MRAVTLSAGGLLLGFASAYLAQMPLTAGRITILATFGILVLCQDLFKRSSPR